MADRQVAAPRRPADGARPLAPGRRRGRPASRVRMPRGRAQRVQAFQIDRRFHLEQQWQRQEVRDAVLASVSLERLREGVVGVADGAHLEALLAAAGSCLVVLMFYSRSCGLCKAVEADLQALLAESRSTRARLVALKHDVRDDFDFPSDVSRSYGIRSVPRLLFLVDGAVVATLGGVTDSRQLSSRAEVSGVLRGQHTRLRQTISQLLLRHAPSARS